MGIKKPYKRTCRQYVNGGYSTTDYILHDKYANSPDQFIRAFLLIQKDLKELFDYVEPAHKNLKCFSFRIQELFIRACFEIEANFKAILRDNGFTGSERIGENIYKKINITHRLSSYEVKYPVWIGEDNIWKPFENWDKKSMEWYQQYNKLKHDRVESFEKANMKNLIQAVGGLIVLLSAQFYKNDFTMKDEYIVGYPRDKFETAIGDYFRIKYPNDWPEEMKYDFDWRKLKNEDEPFDTIDYKKIVIKSKKR